VTYLHIFDRCDRFANQAIQRRIEACWRWAERHSRTIDDHIAWGDAAREPKPQALLDAVRDCKQDRGALVVNHLAVISTDLEVVRWVFAELGDLPVYALQDQRPASHQPRAAMLGDDAVHGAS
jgi:hypothetical protein